MMLLSVGFGLKASKSDALHISSHPFTTKNSVYVKSKKNAQGNDREMCKHWEIRCFVVRGSVRGKEV